MKSKLQALRALSPVERRCLGLAWLYLMAAALALRLLPVARAQKVLSWFAAPRVLAAPPLPGRLAWLTGVAARHHVLRRLTCLPRSLALQALLRRQGIPAELRIGVRREGGDLLAHAWIESEGIPVEDPSGVAGLYFPLTGSIRAV